MTQDSQMSYVMGRFCSVNNSCVWSHITHGSGNGESSSLIYFLFAVINFYRKRRPDSPLPGTRASLIPELKMMTGGLGVAQDANAEVQGVCDAVRRDIEEKARADGQQVKQFKAVSHKTQVPM